MSSLEGKVVVVTRSARGFGYAAAETLPDCGASAIISGRSPEALERAVQSIEGRGAVAGILCDVHHERQVYALARQVMERFGLIDIWINNAGHSSSAGMMLETPPEQAINMFLANDRETLYGAGSFLRPTSPTGLYGGATKTRFASFTRSLGRKLRGSGVH